MAVSTREGLKQYALRALGAPVLEINVDDDQLEDRIDEALEFWRLYHNEGIEKVYLKTLIRASTLTIQSSIADQFNLGDTITGQTSGATARVTVQRDLVSNGTTIYVREVEGTFTSGEVITNGTTEATLAAADAVFLGEIDTHYLEVSDLVYGVTRLLPFAGTQTSKSMFDLQYQLRLNDLYDLASTSIIYYKQVMGHLSLLDMELNGKPMFDFNRLQNRIYPRINWQADIEPGEYIVAECYRALDPTQFSRVWNEIWLKHYTTALFKKQWAVNLKKFQGLQLPGGVTMDGQGLYQEASQEIKDLEEELMTKSAPLQWFMG
jgi:hypothetical protein